MKGTTGHRWCSTKWPVTQPFDIFVTSLLTIVISLLITGSLLYCRCCYYCFFNRIVPNKRKLISLKLYLVHRPIWISDWCKFLPEASFGLRVLSLPASVCVCVSVCLCVNHLLVRAITRDLFKLGSPNLDQRCKRPWLRSLLFWGQLTLTFEVKFNLKVRIYPILSLSGP